MFEKRRHTLLYVSIHSSKPHHVGQVKRIARRRFRWVYSLKWRMHGLTFLFNAYSEIYKIKEDHEWTKGLASSSNIKQPLYNTFAIFDKIVLVI